MKYIIALILSLFIILSCVEKRDLTKNTVIIDLESFPSGLHPTNNSSGTGNFILSYTQMSLIEIDPIEEVYKPLLIKELPKPDSTGLIYFFELNDLGKWDDGDVLTVEDFIFSWKLALCPLTDNPSTRAMYSLMIDDVYPDLNNKRGIFVKVKSPHYNNMQVVAGGVTLMQKKYWDSSKVFDSVFIKDLVNSRFESNKQLDNWFNDYNDAKNGYDPNRLVGMGPYQVSDLENKSYITLTKKINWWGDHCSKSMSAFEAYPDKLIFKVTSDPSTGYLAIKSQEIDVLKHRGSSWISKFKRLKNNQNFNKNYFSAYIDSPIYRYVSMNMRPDGVDHKPYFTDKKVRKAMAYLTPIDEMIEYLLYGHATRQAGIVSPFNKSIDSSLKFIPYDIEKAKQLLSEAGWEDTDGDNIRDKKINGEKVKFRFKLNFYSDPSLKEIAIVMKESMAKAGIVLIPNPLDFGTLFGNARDHKFDAMLAAWSGSVTYSDPNQIWSTRSWALKGSNFNGFGDAESDSLIKAANIALDEKGHLQAYQSLQRKIYDEQPYIFFWSEQYVMACHKRFSNSKFFRVKPNINLNSLILEHK